LTVAGDASLQAAGGISINGAITPSSAPNLTLNAGTNALQATFASTAINPFGSLSVTAGSLTLGGGLYSTNSIGINAPITISSDATFDSSAEGITLSGAVNGNNSNPALTLSAPGAISLQSLGSTNSLGDVSISGSGVALAGSIGSVGSIDITGPVTISSALILSGTSVTLNSDLGAASSTDYNFNIYGSSITVQNLGTNISSMGNIILSSSGPISCGNLYSLHSITLTGTDIILGTTLVAPETTNINNTGSLTISGTTISTGMFSQKGTGNVSLSASIATGGSISFSGPLTVSGTVSLEGLGGITISGGITPSSAPNLTLNAGANGLQATFTSTALNPFGSLSFTAGSLILGGDLYSTASILIDTPVTISADTTFASSAGNITLSGSLSGNSSNLNLNLTALGTISLQSLGSGIVPLRNVTISGDLVDLAGNIISVGLLEITGPVTISSSLTLQGNAGVTLNSNLVPDSLNLDLTVASYTTGSISVQNLGTISASLGGITLSNIASTEVAGPISCGNLYSSGNIAIRGTTIGLGSTLSAVGSISIDNEELLTISSGTSITAASFSQKGPGNVSLSAEINTTGLISFSGPLTVSGTVSLEGAGGIIASGGITPSSAPNLILNAGANALQATFNSTESNPFGSLSITAGSFTLGGGLYSTNAIEINAPITISSNATISSSAGGITLSEAVNGSSSTQYFDLSLIAQSGTISLQSLGRTGPLGNVTISGGLVDLAANIISIGLLEITGPITISPSLTLQGNAGVTLNSNLIPDGLNSDLTVASYTTGSISVQNLGTISAPLGSITLSNIASTEVAGPISCGNLYSSGNIDLSGTTIGLGSTLSAEGIISINNTALLTISSGISIAAAGFSQTGLGAVSLNENIDISGAISFTGPITIESSVALIGSSIALGTVSANSSLNFSLTSTSGAITASSLGIDGFPLNDVTIHNVGSLTVPLLYLTGNFSQTGSGAVSLNSDIDIPGTISFEGPITIGSRVSLQGSTIDLASLSASATGLDLNLTSTSGAVSVISLGESGTALQNVTIHNATVLTMPSLNIEGSFSQTGAPVSLLANVYAGGSISFEGALTVAGNAILNGKEGITISSITASGTPNLTLNAGLYPLSATFVSSEVQPFGPLSVTASNFILAGDLYSNGLIAIAAPMTISADTTIFSTTSGITLSSALGSENSGAALNLRAASLISVQSLGNTSIPLGDVTIIGTGVTLGGDVVSEGSIAITGPITSSTSLLSLTGNFGITLDNDLTSSTSSNVHFEAIEGPITVQNLGTSGSKLGDIEIVGFRSVSSGNLFSSKSISLMGTDITFGSSFIASQDVNISNTGPINMAFAPLTLSGNFTQSGVGAVSLGATINAAGTISFAGETLTISSATTLKGTKGISIVSSLAPSSGTHPNFTLNAGSNPLSAVFGSTASNPFGALSVTASNFTLGGNLYSNTSIAIYAPMTISANTEINSLNGYQGIYLSKAVSATIPFLSLTVSGSQGPVDVGALGTVDVPLGGISLSGTEITLRGNILSTGTVVLNGDSTIENNLTLQGDQGITLQNILLPSTDAFTLALKASGGSILTQNLGSPAQYMGNISLLGTNFNVGSTTVSSGSSVTFSNNSGSVHIDGPCSVNPPCTYPAYSYP
jgi:molybdopterin-binding protein